jgi:hypothetical protein
MRRPSAEAIAMARKKATRDAADYLSSSSCFFDCLCRLQRIYEACRSTPVTNTDNCRPEWIKSAPWPDQMKRDHGAACARNGSFQFAPPKTY